MTIKIIPNDHGNPPGKLADAELHFTDGALSGLKLIGFGIWERPRNQGRNVTFPARQYSVNGERRSFALLRPIFDSTKSDRDSGSHPRSLRRTRRGDDTRARPGRRADAPARRAAHARRPILKAEIGRPSLTAQGAR